MRDHRPAFMALIPDRGEGDDLGKLYAAIKEAVTGQTAGLVLARPVVKDMVDRCLAMFETMRGDLKLSFPIALAHLPRLLPVALAGEDWAAQARSVVTRPVSVEVDADKVMETLPELNPRGAA